MPTDIRRINIHGGTGSSALKVQVGNDVLVDTVLRNEPNQFYAGIHATTGGTVEITTSSNVRWAIVQLYT